MCVCFCFFSLLHLLSIFSLFVLVCLSFFVCVAGIGLGSSPTSSQNEALPPSTDWPVSAYTSSFSLSSPEMDDAGTWFVHNPPLPHTVQWLNHQSPNHSQENPISPASFKFLLLTEHDLHLSSPVRFLSHAVHIPPAALPVSLFALECCLESVEQRRVSVVFPSLHESYSSGPVKQLSSLLLSVSQTYLTYTVCSHIVWWDGISC